MDQPISRHDEELGNAQEQCGVDLAEFRGKMHDGIERLGLEGIDPLVDMVTETFRYAWYRGFNKGISMTSALYCESIHETLDKMKQEDIG